MYYITPSCWQQCCDGKAGNELFRSKHLVIIMWVSDFLDRIGSPLPLHQLSPQMTHLPSIGCILLQAHRKFTLVRMRMYVGVMNNHDVDLERKFLAHHHEWFSEWERRLTLYHPLHTLSASALLNHHHHHHHHHRHHHHHHHQLVKRLGLGRVSRLQIHTVRWQLSHRANIVKDSLWKFWGNGISE